MKPRYNLAHATMLHSRLYGVTCTQVFFYYRNYPSDDLIIKLSVSILLNSRVDIFRPAFDIKSGIDSPVSLLMRQHWLKFAELMRICEQRT